VKREDIGEEGGRPFALDRGSSRERGKKRVFTPAGGGEIRRRSLTREGGGPRNGSSVAEEEQKQKSTRTSFFHRGKEGSTAIPTLIREGTPAPGRPAPEEKRRSRSSCREKGKEGRREEGKGSPLHRKRHYLLFFGERHQREDST